MVVGYNTSRALPNRLRRDGDTKGIANSPTPALVSASDAGSIARHCALCSTFSGRSETMIPHGVDVFVGLDPIDRRWGSRFTRLSRSSAERIGREVRGGAMFIFFGRRKEVEPSPDGGFPQRESFTTGPKSCFRQTETDPLRQCETDFPYVQYWQPNGNDTGPG